MYEVFVNKSLVYPGFAPPESKACKQLRLPLNTGPEIILSAISKLIDSPLPLCLFLGQNGEEKQAWGILQSILKAEFAMGGLVWHRKKGLLMIRRLGYWDFPKGKPQAGENPAETAIREVEEECGIASPECGALFGMTHHIFQRQDALYLKQNQWFTMHSDAEGALHPQLEEGITEVRWMQFEDFLKIRDEVYPSLLSLAEGFWERKRTEAKR